MGRSYTVPRSAKGETRILYIFTLKSLAITLLFMAIGFFVATGIGKIAEIGLVGKVIVCGSFGAVGFVIGAAKIPDSPFMGPLQKAGGEEIFTILLRLITFGKRRKIYIYGLTRKKNDVKLDDEKEGVFSKFKF